MFWEQQLINSGGQTIRLYNQGQDNRSRVSGNREGFCAGISAWWIIKSRAQQRFWPWFDGPGEGIESVIRMQAVENSLDTGWLVKAIETFSKDPSRGFQALKGVMAGGGRVEEKGYFTCECVINALTGVSLRGEPKRTPIPGYKLLGIYSSTGSRHSGHAMAAYVSQCGSGPVWFMDPNAGEFRFNDPHDFAGFFQALWADKYRKYMSGYFVLPFT
ncbi:MAG: YopT-type cysteine protease domain-containing protein [Myxococcota bacterium]